MNLTDEQLRNFARDVGRPCRSSLLEFTKYTHGNYVVSPFSEVLAYELQDVIERTERGEQVYKMINTPPRRGKSELASQKAPAWAIGRNPNWQVILVSYAQGLANKFSRRTRDTVASDRYGLIFPEIKLNVKSQSVQEWEYVDDSDPTQQHEIGTFRAAGAGGGITGMGAHLLITDDPIKNAEEAESETIRDSRYDGYISDIRTRKMPGASELMIYTRWHEDDPGGRLLEEEGTVDEGGLWELVKIPLFCTDPANDPLGRDLGDHLEDGRFSKEEQEKLRIQMNTSPRKRYFFNALYQQDPSPMEDLPFPSIERNKLTIESPAFREYTPYMVVDIASSEKQSADNTAILVGGINAVKHRPVVFSEEIKKKPAARNTIILERWRRLNAANECDTVFVEGSEDVLVGIRRKFRDHGEEDVRIEPLAHKGRSKATRIEELDNYYRHYDDLGELHGTMDVGPEAELFATRLTSWSRHRGGHDDIEDAGAYFCEVAVYQERTQTEWSDMPDDPVGQKIWKAKRKKKEIGLG